MIKQILIFLVKTNYFLRGKRILKDKWFWADIMLYEKYGVIIR